MSEQIINKIHEYFNKESRMVLNYEGCEPVPGMRKEMLNTIENYREAMIKIVKENK